MQRFRMQSELRAKVEELSVQLDAAVARHLQLEVQGAASRAGELITPFATLADSKRLEHDERAAKLRAARESVDELTRELREITKG